MRKPDGTSWTALEPGDYARQVPSETAPDDGWWVFVTPNGITFNILEDNAPKHHKLTVHEDGTVTLSPSVLCASGSCGIAEGYHGFLERGVWRSC